MKHNLSAWKFKWLTIFAGFGSYDWRVRFQASADCLVQYSSYWRMCASEVHGSVETAVTNKMMKNEYE